MLTPHKMSASLAFYYIFVLGLTGFTGMHFSKNGIDIRWFIYPLAIIAIGYIASIFYKNRKEKELKMIIIVGLLLSYIVIFLSYYITH